MDKQGMNIAALAALLEGDFENAIIAQTPGGIEAQEAAGQQSFVASETLPKECLYCSRGQLEQMGIIFGKPADDLFVNVQLPDGWEKVTTNHSMHSKLVDDKGRERASIFYKAAFYDRSAHISLTRRFCCIVEPVKGYNVPDYEEGGWHCVVKDCGETSWCSDNHLAPQPQGNDEKSRELRLAWYKEKDKLGEPGKAWLDEHYPDWQDPLAYWD